MDFDWQWQSLSKTPRVIGIDGRAFLPVILLVVNLSIKMLLIVIVNIIFFAVLEKLGLTVPAFFRKIIYKMRGKIMFARSANYYKRFRYSK
jgi:type IV secretory pathway VirB3-like protein